MAEFVLQSKAKRPLERIFLHSLIENLNAQTQQDPGQSPVRYLALGHFLLPRVICLGELDWRNGFE